MTKSQPIPTHMRYPCSEILHMLRDQSPGYPDPLDPDSYLAPETMQVGLNAAPRIARRVANQCYALLANRGDIATQDVGGKTKHAITMDGLRTMGELANAPAQAPRSAARPPQRKSFIEAEKEKRAEATKHFVLYFLQNAEEPQTFQQIWEMVREEHSQPVSETELFAIMRQLVDAQCLTKGEMSAELRAFPYSLTDTGRAYLHHVEAARMGTPG